ncbi:SRPBCC family protein [Brevibacillus sp. B_LB10_24]|uniref:SRPBCC family protein n=1 Tax=Brevibacillus sp. B_LB10_24 TaxID=3380645 RepID=UPI0038B77172
MSEHNTMNDGTYEGENELVTTRLIDAPRDLVFQAWTSPEYLAQWWGPKGFTNTFHEFDLRPGGTWKFVMHGPDGVDYKNKSIFDEIVPPERIVFRHVSGPKFQVTATFENLDGKTRITYRMRFETAAEFDKVKTYAAEGNEQNFDRLEELLQKMSA